ncbi:MAG: FGGY-family carbohydrate kinase [Candidatus Omnitrophota bacterium]|nr:FGGY-family carbohydrate kinase [Candidatus Omnitrophota bacterium]
MRNNHKIIAENLRLPFKIKKAALALGTQAKNTLCFAEGDTAYISRAHPDLSTPEDLSNFEKDVRFFLKRNPRIIACDLHPDYASTKYARQLRATNDPSISLGAGERRTTPRFHSGQANDPSTWFDSAHHRSLGVNVRRPIQHHHAHIASCMAENGLINQRVIGVAFDGTGLGSDNTLWGAEFLICDYNTFQRSAHLRDIPLLGGEAAVREPWRVAAAWLYTAYPREFARLGIGFIRGLDKNKWGVLKKMYATGFNSVSTSSMGRLFDAAASIILEDHEAGGEAELAIKLEKMAQTSAPKQKPYHFKIFKKDGIYIIDPITLFKEIVVDIKNHRPKEAMAYSFHLGVAVMLKNTCLVLRRKHKISRVALSGGVFQNSLLLRLGSALLYKEGFEVFTHKKISCNDSGVSLGQAVIAAQLYFRGLETAPLRARMS